MWKSNFFQRLDRSGLGLYWMLLALGAMFLSGIFAVFIVVARIPGVAELIHDPDFFRRALVIHVDLAIVVWLTAFPVAFFHLLNGDRPVEKSAKFSWSLAVAGLVLMVVSGFSQDGSPYLANYVPVISHPLFMVGLALYFCGVALNYLSFGLLGGGSTSGVLGLTQLGVRLGALYFLVSLVVFFISRLLVPDGLPGQTHFEMTMWAGGHVLQFANEAFMLVCWTWLLTEWLGESPLQRNQAFFVFALLGLALFLIPLASVQDITSSQHRTTFTYLMRWGMFPAVGLYLFFVIPKVVAGLRKGLEKSVFFWSFALSVFLILSGIVFGFLIRGPNMIVPGHYHASIGSVTLAFMGTSLLVLRELGLLSSRDIQNRKNRYFAMSYGWGQFIFAFGMVLAGSYGLGRKMYGVEQHIRHPMETAGMMIMGGGGLIALVGGYAFAVTIVLLLKRRIASARTMESVETNCLNA